MEWICSQGENVLFMLECSFFPKGISEQESKEIVTTEVILLVRSCVNFSCVFSLLNFCTCLTYPMLNKLRCHAHCYFFQPIRTLDTGCWCKFTNLMTNSADPDHMDSSEAKWSGSILFAKIAYPGLFVCVEVLRPSQSNGVMSSAVSLPNHTFIGQA